MQSPSAALLEWTCWSRLPMLRGNGSWHSPAGQWAVFGCYCQNRQNRDCSCPISNVSHTELARRSHVGGGLVFTPLQPRQTSITLRPVLLGWMSSYYILQMNYCDACCMQSVVHIKACPNCRRRWWGPWLSWPSWLQPMAEAASTNVVKPMTAWLTT